MSYITAAQLQEALGDDRYLDLSDRDRDGTPDAAAVTGALDRATNLIDSYIAAYLPVASPIPAVLEQHVIDVSVYVLAGNAATEDERKRFEDALRWLKDVQAGRAQLYPPADTTAPAQPMVVKAPKSDWDCGKAKAIF